VTRHVAVTVSHRPARPWWVLPMPHVSGLVGVVVLTLWLSVAACWYPVVLGALLVKYAVEGVTRIAQVVASNRAMQPQPQPQSWPPPKLPTDPSAPLWTHQQIVDWLPERVGKDFAA
jgi:hypothetical protein